VEVLLRFLLPKPTPFARSLALLLGFACFATACGTSSRVIAPAFTPAPLATAVINTRTPTPPATPMPTATPFPTATPTAVPPWRFVVLGDTRTAGLRPPEVTYAIVERAAAAQPDVVLCVGDMINALDTQSEVREQWRNWREAVAPLGTQDTDREAPWLLVTPGNHDVQGNVWATDLLAEAFPELPANGPPGYLRRTYTVDYRDVRFISVDSEPFGDLHHLGDAQLDWLEAQLRDNPNRHTLIFSHDPAYPLGPHVGSSLDAYPQERDRFWALLREYRVTAYIAGHEHLYNHQEIEGVDQIIAGTSGSFIYTGYGGEFYHYVVGEVAPDGITFVTYDQSGQERDRFSVS
jgi:3',5'-cyclic-AMP phosphodiesterase